MCLVVIDCQKIISLYMDLKRIDETKWVDSYSDMLMRFAYSRIRDRETAMDLVQDTFLSALKSVDSFKGEISEKNWLFLILRNKIIDYYRKQARSMVTNVDFSENDDDSHFDENGVWKKSTVPNDWGTDAHTKIENQEFQSILQKCLSKLKEVQRIVFTLKYMNDEESETICKELEINSNNYWVIIHRAKLNLRKCIELNWFSE